MNILDMFKRKRTREEIDFHNEKPEGKTFGRDLHGFIDLEEIEVKGLHTAYKWGEFYYFGQLGSTWQLFNKYGLPLTDRMHNFTLEDHCTLKGTLGASEYEFDMDKIYSFDEGLQKMMKQMIKESSNEQ